MRSCGQGRHLAVSILELEGPFDLERFVKALEAFGRAYPVIFGEVTRGRLFSVPAWRLGDSGVIECCAHGEDKSSAAVALFRLSGGCTGHLCFDVIRRRGGVEVVMTWNHLLWDGRGAELTLAEISRFWDAPEREGMPFERWGLSQTGRMGFTEKLRVVRPFAVRHSELRRVSVVSAGRLNPEPSRPCFEFLRFSVEETEQIRRRADAVTGGIFSLPYFLAVTMRAHALILERRGVSVGALECAVSTQLRKRGGLGGLFQNQVSQMFFSLTLAQTGDLAEAARELHRQFERANREGAVSGFLVMVDWMRRLPRALYQLFLKREASGHITSFYYAHTGNFMPGVKTFCGASIQDGWHVPSVFQPPGTGLFFSERSGRLTASLCWRTGVLSEDEVQQMLGVVRTELLGEG